jgi:hypothetical protein
MAESRVVVRIEVTGIGRYRDLMHALAFGLEVTTIMLGWAPRQLEAHAYPGQPTHHSAPPVKPCTCAYHVVNTPEDGLLVVPARKPTPGPWEPDPFEVEYTYAVWYPRCPVLSWFTIRRTCPHHGARLELHHYPNTTVPRSMLEDYPGSIL